MIEVEVKFPVNKLETLRQQIRQLGGHYCNTRREVDMYFDFPDYRLARNDKALRIREYSSPGTTQTEIEVTFKGPKTDSTTKTREETTLQILSSVKLVHQVIRNLDFIHVGTVKKNREKWVIRDVCLYLDDVDGLGTFVEIENMALPEEVDNVRGQLLDIANQLGFSKGSERKSYLELLLEKGTISS